MNDKYVKEYAKGIAENSYKLAEGLFHAEYIMEEYKTAIWEFLEEIGVVYSPGNKDHYRLEDIAWDNYDESIELIDCEDGFTLTTDQYNAIKRLGFEIIFVNYKKGPHIHGRMTASEDAMPIIKDG